MRYIQSLRSLYSHPYNRARPWFALFRFAGWHLRKRLRETPWEQSLWHGRRRARFFPDSRESMFLAYNHIMDWHEFNFIARYLRPADTAVDVGANIGVYLLWMSTSIGPAGRIVAFEPDAENFRRLSAQLEINALPWVRVEALALSDSEGELRFSVGKDMENHIVAADTAGTPTTRVLATTLDRYAENEDIESIAFLKIDVEGGELFVLNGASGLLADRRIDVIQLEFNTQAEKYGLYGGDVAALLRRYGYALYRYDTAANTLVETPVPGADHCNLFAIADAPRVRARLLAAPAAG